MNMDDMILVSVDDHLVEPPDFGDRIKEYLPSKFHDRAPKLLRDEDGSDVWVFENSPIPNIALNAVAGRVPEEYGLEPTCFEELRPSTYDVDKRVEDMNANGVLGSLCFPSFPGLAGQTISLSKDLELSRAMIRAYNDWHLEDWAGQYPARFIPLSLSGFTCGADFMAEEVRRVADKGCRAVSFYEKPEKFGFPDHHGDEWDPFWAACDEIGMVVCFHLGAMPVFSPRSPMDVLIHTMSLHSGVFASELLWSPVLRKFKNVKCALSEGSIGWVPYFLERADTVYRHHRAWTGQDFGDKLPSEVFRERIVTCFIEDTVGLKLLDELNEDTVTWECDFPHSDTTWPTGPERLWHSIDKAKISDEQINKITYQNACRVFEFDPFEDVPKAEATVGALREKARHVDVTPRSTATRERPAHKTGAHDMHAPNLAVSANE